MAEFFARTPVDAAYTHIRNSGITLDGIADRINSTEDVMPVDAAVQFARAQAELAQVNALLAIAKAETSGIAIRTQALQAAVTWASSPNLSIRLAQIPVIAAEVFEPYLRTGRVLTNDEVSEVLSPTQRMGRNTADNDDTPPGGDA